MRRLLLGLCLPLSLAIPARAGEELRNFVNDVTVNADASLTVRETITVNVEGNEIRHGIRRDFPTIYKDRHGQRVSVGFEVLEVKRNGTSEPYAIESISNGKSIKIGDGDVVLDHGSHSYQIAYRTTRQLGFFEDVDELYWNVTGNGWTFPILEATAIVRLPPGAHIQQHHEYTGVQGATGADVRVLVASGAEYRASTTRRLEAGEGFTVAVAWQKGIVAAPTGSDRWNWWLSDNAGTFSLIVCIVASGLYYLFAWNKVGRDPPKGVIVPLFTPPAGLGPAGLRFIWKQGCDDRAFAAALVGLAVKDRLTIVDDDNEYSIQKKSDAGPPLTQAERALFYSLPAGATELKKGNHLMVRALRNTLENALMGEYEGSVFIRNLGWFWKGALLSAVGLMVAALFLPAEDSLTGLLAVGGLSIWWGAILAVAWAAIKGLFTARGILEKLGWLMAVLFIIPFMIVGIAVPAALWFSGGSAGLSMLMGTAVVLAIMNLVFFHLLRAPTVEGRKLLDQIEGFRMYMATAEEGRLNILNPPEKTPELFERYLPYALALDCENEWNGKFTAVLAAAAAAGAAAPLWYSGNHWDSGRTGGFTDRVGSSLASSVSSASTSPGSSSGSSGGGSSGGGGGGGGGSGW